MALAALPQSVSDSAQDAAAELASFGDSVREVVAAWDRYCRCDGSTTEFPRLQFGMLGSQSSGKSRLLCLLTKGKITFESENTGTRCPVVIMFQSSAATESFHFGKQDTDSGMKSGTLKEAVKFVEDHMRDLGESMDEKEIYVRIKGPKHLTFSIVDLPGFVPVNLDKAEKLNPIIKRMYSNYLKRDHFIPIVLAAIPHGHFDKDAIVSDLKTIRQETGMEDKHCRRAVLFIAKIDLAKPNLKAKPHQFEVYKGNAIEAGFSGEHIVFASLLPECLDPRNSDPEVPPNAAWELQSSYFRDRVSILEAEHLPKFLAHCGLAPGVHNIGMKDFYRLIDQALTQFVASNLAEIIMLLKKRFATLKQEAQQLTDSTSEIFSIKDLVTDYIILFKNTLLGTAGADMPEDMQQHVNRILKRYPGLVNKRKLITLQASIKNRLKHSLKTQAKHFRQRHPDEMVTDFLFSSNVKKKLREDGGHVINKYFRARVYGEACLLRLFKRTLFAILAEEKVEFDYGDICSFGGRAS